MRRLSVSFLFAVLTTMAATCPAYAATAQSCYVSPVAIRNPRFAEYPDATVSVEIFSGYTSLFITPRKPLTNPEFTNRIRFSTSKAMPVRLVVRVWRGDVVPQAGQPPAHRQQGRARSSSGGAASRAGSGDGNDMLGMAFDGLVADYDAVPMDTPRDDEARQAARPVERGARSSAVVSFAGSTDSFILCDVTIAWPPVDGIHTIECGDSQLEVKTLMITR